MTDYTLKGEIINYLAGVTSISNLVGGKIYSRRIDAERGLPAIVLSKATEYSEFAHDGPQLTRTTLAVYIFAESDKQLELIKQAINAELNGKLITTANVTAQLFLVGDSDFDDYESLELNEWAGLLEYEVNW